VASVVRYGVRWDPEEEAWVLPIRSLAGDVWGYQTKSAEQVLNHPPGCPKSRTLFGLDIAMESGLDDYIVLVESPLDVVYLDNLGYPAVASFGATVSNHQLRLLVSYFGAIVLALDNDGAGRAETKRVLASHWCRQLPFEVLNYSRTQAKDPGEMSEDTFERAMETAIFATHWEPV
jgi:DNA primase